MSQAPLLAPLLDLESEMKRLKQLLFAALAAALATASLVTGAHAQSNASGPFATPSGELQFVRDDRDFVSMLNREKFDRFDAKTLMHFDEVGANGAITRTLVQTAYGPVVYDLRRNPPLVQRANVRMTVKRVFWQPDEAVMQSPEGWFQLKNGTLTKLQATKTTYH
ncbi:Nuclear transport factor 2 family protein [Paraburkholderia sacchari]